MPQSHIYAQLFNSFCDYICTQDSRTTTQVTRAIKAFFQQTFQPPHIVLCGHAAGSEYMTDVLVTSFNPKTIVKARSLQLTAPSISVHLAVESELGGVGASSPYGVMKNVVEDYLKLLVIRSEYRVMIFTSLPYAKEVDHVARRVEVLRDIYSRSAGLTSGMLLIHLNGSQPHSTQVQVSVTPGSLRGFVVSRDGRSVEELATPVT